jgi:hypothetical protein
MPFRGTGEGTRGEPWIGLPGSGAEAARHDLLTQSRHQAEDGRSIQEGHIAQSEVVLVLHKGLEVFGLDLVLCDQQVAALLILEVGFQFRCQRGPASEGGAGEGRLSRVESLRTHASGTGPGGRGLDRDPVALHDEDGAALPGHVVSDGAAEDPPTNNEHLNRCRWMGHLFGISFISSFR